MTDEDTIDATRMMMVLIGIDNCQVHIESRST